MMILKKNEEMMHLAKRRKLCIGLACALALLGLGVSTAWADLRFEAKGTEYDLTGKLVGDQLATQVAISPSGGYLVWHDNATDQSGLGVSALMLDANANPVGSPFRVNTQLLGNQEKPQVGLLSEGGAFFVWEAGATGFRRVQFRATNSRGLFSKEETFVTVANSGEQTDPSLAVLRHGTVAVAWTDYLLDGDVKGLSARIYSPAGDALTEPFQLNQFRDGNQYGARLQALPNGGFAAVWVSDQQQDEKSIDIIARLFNSVGQPLTNEVVVSQKGISANPVLGIAGDRLVIVWEQVDLKNKKTRWDVSLRVFNLGLNPLAEQVKANKQLEGDQFAPRLQGDDSGALLVWNSLGQDGSREAVMGRFISESGLFIDSEFQVNTRTFAGQLQPNVSTDAAGKWLVTWSTPRRGDFGMDVVGQRFQIESTEAKPLEPIAVVFVNPLSENELMVSWPEVAGLEVDHYEIFIDNIPDPKSVNRNFFIWKQLQPGREYSFRVVYQLKDGRRSPMSAFGFNKTWGRDFNLDGLPDDWQTAFFGRDSGKWPATNADSDGDGATNFNEFLAGTNPADTSSSLKLELSAMEQGQRLSWQTEPGSVYQLEKANRLGPGVIQWRAEGDPVVAVEAAAGLSLKAVENMSFYRVKRIQ
jgi:hypothetical protein